MRRPEDGNRNGQEGRREVKNGTGRTGEEWQKGTKRRGRAGRPTRGGRKEKETEIRQRGKWRPRQTLLENWRRQGRGEAKGKIEKEADGKRQERQKDTRRAPSPPTQAHQPSRGVFAFVSCSSEKIPGRPSPKAPRELGQGAEDRQSAALERSQLPR